MTRGSRTVVDLRSDTVTRPGPAMREAIASAETGDDALGDDPTVRHLEQRVATILDKPDALFFPSGIMANQTALSLLTRPGTELICEASCHLVDWELGGAAALSGVQLRGVPASRGQLTAALIAPHIRPTAARLQIQTSCIALENTHNGAGGTVLPLQAMRDVRALADAHSLPVHLDGARLWNASAATGVPEAEYAACADTVMVALSKGLGCPVGSVLAGEEDLIARARIQRRRFGGTMRQVGILAAAGLYALEHHRERLAEDHARARTLARLVALAPGLRVIEPETNIVMMDLTHPSVRALDVLPALAEMGVLMTEFSPVRLRAVMHLDVDDAGVRDAADAIVSVMGRLVESR